MNPRFLCPRLTRLRKTVLPLTKMQEDVFSGVSVRDPEDPSFSVIFPEKDILLHLRKSLLPMDLKLQSIRKVLHLLHSMAEAL